MSATIFTVKRSKIEGRLDPIYYIRKNELVGYKHLKLEKIGKHFFVKDGDHDKLPDDAISDEQSGFRYLRAQDLKDNKIISEKPIYVTKKYFESVKRCHIYPNDLLFSIMASVGATAVVPQNSPICTANRAVGILRSKAESLFIPEYVQVVLNTELGIKLLELQKRGGIQQRVNLDDISNLELPLFDFEKQGKIIDFYNSALSQKEQKQEQAKALLDGIDSYLLSELGITLPQKDNSLSKRIFTTKFSEVSGGRLDCSYTFKSSALNAEFKKIKCESLENLIVCSPQYGANEEAVDFDDKVRYIRITDIDELGNLKETELKSAETIEEKFLLNENDILFARSGSVGRCYIHKDISRKAIFAGYLIRFVLNDSLINPDYLFYYCNSSIYKYWVDSIQRPSVQANINSQEYKSLKIPLPPLPKQKEIAEHIRGIRAQAKQFQAEAEQIIQDAKHQIERMILGDEE